MVLRGVLVFRVKPFKRWWRNWPTCILVLGCIHNVSHNNFIHMIFFRDVTMVCASTLL